MQLICEERPRHLQGSTCSTFSVSPVSPFPMTWDNTRPGSFASSHSSSYTTTQGKSGHESAACVAWGKPGEGSYTPEQTLMLLFCRFIRCNHRNGMIICGNMLCVINKIRPAGIYSFACMHWHTYICFLSTLSPYKIIIKTLHISSAYIIYCLSQFACIMLLLHEQDTSLSVKLWFLSLSLLKYDFLH